MIKVADDICAEHYAPFVKGTDILSITLLKLQTRCTFLNLDTLTLTTICPKILVGMLFMTCLDCLGSL